MDKVYIDSTALSSLIGAIKAKSGSGTVVCKNVPSEVPLISNEYINKLINNTITQAEFDTICAGLTGLVPCMASANITKINAPYAAGLEVGPYISNWSHLTELHIPSATSVPTDTIKGATGLVCITVGPNMNFNNLYFPESTSNFNKVNYTGTIDQWATSSFNNRGRNPLTRAHNLYINNVLADNITITSQTINQYAFSGATCLIGLVLSGTTTINTNAFENCTNLLTVSLGNALTSIGSNSFSNSGITTIIIPDTVIGLGTSAFSGCSSLTNAVIGSGITIIANSLFSGCSSLASITIPSGITSIGNSAFSGCSSLTSITIPAGVTYIGTSAFSGCSSLTGITLPSGITIIGASTFLNCSSLTSMIIPAGVSTIGKQAFSGCSHINNDIVIPSGVTEIMSETFNGCSRVPSITIPDSVTSIDIYAFKDCTSLSTIFIPSTCTTISDKYGSTYRPPFFGCNSSLEIYTDALSKPSGWGDSFNNYSVYAAEHLTVHYGISRSEYEALIGGNS